MANMYDYNTSTARKLILPDEYYGHTSKRESSDPKTTNHKKAAQKAYTVKSFKGILTVALAFVMAFFVVNGYVAINEANNEISTLKNQYNSIVAENQAVQVKIDKTIDIEMLQTTAGEKFGMVRPERYQMFYVDLKMDDFSEKTKDVKEIKKQEKQEKYAQMGVPGIISGTLNIFQ